MSLLLILLQLILIEAGLSWDNVAVNYGYIRKLPTSIQSKVMMFGTVLAIIFRFALMGVAVWLLQFPFLKTIGGIWILLVAFKMLVDSDEEEDKDVSVSRVVKASIMLAVTDFSMSLDNGVASAGIAQGHWILLLIAVGATIPIFLLGMKPLQWVMTKLPQIMYLISAILAWVGGKMIYGDGTNLVNAFKFIMQQPEWVVSVGIAVIVLLIGVWVNYRENKARETVTA